MLIDNKTQFEPGEPARLIDYFLHNLEEGRFDLVTGYFSISALAKFFVQLNQPQEFRMILGDLVHDEGQLRDRIIDLIKEFHDVDFTLKLQPAAEKAIQFLQQEKVHVKTIDKNFCHAKSYIYHSQRKKDSFYIVGSSNLTDAGLGCIETGNIELNKVVTGGDTDFKELTNWFSNLWKAAKSDVLAEQGRKNFKEHLIHLIQSLFKKYTPEEIYYKILYELFRNELIDFDLQTEAGKTFKHLKKHKVYEMLYPFQKKGVLSLIRMLQKFNGAILADAVGLGKTWQALAVMKFFEMEGYKVVVLCPKKLRNNWEQYRFVHHSLFKKDRLDFVVRNHTDLQFSDSNQIQAVHAGLSRPSRLDGYTDFPLAALQDNPKLLFVIDESHNLRNDKSERYKFLVEHLLQKNDDVKVLLLSATPINNYLNDVRNQFKLMVKGNDAGFAGGEIGIHSLEVIFRQAETKFRSWQKQPQRKMADFISQLPQKFFELTDSLIVARTRELIKNYLDGELVFPDKLPPLNIYESPQNLANLKTFDEILDQLQKIYLTAYKAAHYTPQREKKSVLEDERQRQSYLVKMMFILMMKRLESSWFSFRNTVTNLLTQHENALEKVNSFIKTRQEEKISTPDQDQDTEEELDEVAAELGQEVSIGKRNPIPLSQIQDIEKFHRHLYEDVQHLKRLKDNLDLFEAQVQLGKAQDTKLERLIGIAREKQKSSNKKLLIFTVYTDTAKYLFHALRKQGFQNVAYVSGTLSEDDSGFSGPHFENILQRFAPYTKLYKEMDWSDLYRELPAQNQTPSFEQWQELIRDHRHEVWKKLQKPIDILIATDCLSEGQNLQDCDWVVNYDIHWNPVRLIQRFGRIDRLGSPHAQIRGINFFPAQNYEDFLRLKDRIEYRMAAMTLVGSEIVEPTESIQELVRENPLMPQQAERMLRQLQTTWDDIETGEEKLGLDDLSMEQYRQELLELLMQDREKYERMPNGIFSGLKLVPDLFDQHPADGLIALLGYPRSNPNQPKPYEKYHLLFTADRKALVFNNHFEILAFLRKHKLQPRYVPEAIDGGEESALNRLRDLIQQWMDANIPKEAEKEIGQLLLGGLVSQVAEPPRPKSKKEQMIEEYFCLDNFDLITWLVVSKP